MANSISTASAEMSEQLHAAESFAVPLEQRTDVTVDELEKLLLPFPAELYNGKVVYKIPNFTHAVIQNNPKLTDKTGLCFVSLYIVNLFVQ